MTDAFTDSRYGFDLIVGNPPWDKAKAIMMTSSFSPYYPAFRAMNPNKDTKDSKKRRDYRRIPASRQNL